MPWPQCGDKVKNKYYFYSFYVYARKDKLNKAVATVKGDIFDFKIVKMFL